MGCAALVVAVTVTGVGPVGAQSESTTSTAPATSAPGATAAATAITTTVGAATTVGSETTTPGSTTSSTVAAPSTTAPSTTAPSTTAASTTAATPVAAAPGPPVRLQVATVPSGASVTITASDGQTRTGRTPFSADVPSGELAMVLTLSGRVTRSERIRLTGPAQLTRWLDPAGQLLATRFQLRTGSNPKQVAFTPDGTQLWVPLLGSRGVEVFDATSGARLGLVTLGAKGGGVEVIFDATGQRAYVSQMETASVYEIDVATRRVLRRFATGGNWTKVLALSIDGTTLWAANWVSNDISEIDLATGRLRRKIPTVRTPRASPWIPPDRAVGRRLRERRARPRRPGHRRAAGARPHGWGDASRRDRSRVEPALRRRHGHGSHLRRRPRRGDADRR